MGDYARDTGHLSALEHGIYTLLLDWYYVNERPIPDDKAVRISRGNPEETHMVLSEFFKRTENGWIHSRADREIELYRAKADHNREVGKLGGRPKKTQTVPKQNPDITLATNPLTIKEQDQKTAPKGDFLAGIDPEIASDFKALRAKLRAPITATAMKGIQREADKAGISLQDAIRACCENSWRGFKAHWFENLSRNFNGTHQPRESASGRAERIGNEHLARIEAREAEGRGDGALLAAHGRDLRA